MKYQVTLTQEATVIVDANTAHEAMVAAQQATGWHNAKATQIKPFSKLHQLYRAAGLVNCNSCPAKEYCDSLEGTGNQTCADIIEAWYIEGEEDE